MRIAHKLLLANAAVIVPIVAIVGLLSYRSVERGFLAYVRDLEMARLAPAVERLGRAYGAEGGWDFLREHPECWGEMLQREEPEPRRGPPPPPPPPNEDAPPPRDNPPRGDPRDPPPRPPPPPPPPNEHAPPPRDERGPPNDAAGHDPLELPPRAALFDANQKLVVGARFSPDAASLTPIRWHERTVGYLGVVPIRRLERELDLDYLGSQRRQIGLVAGVAVVLGLVVSLLLARSFVAPIRSLARGTERLRRGELEARVAVGASDELGQLARDFNALAKTLSDAEIVRKQWFADTSHELRTPVAVLRALIEAIQDGVREPTPETLASLHEQVTALAKLVDDIHDLARLDAGELRLEKRPLAPGIVLGRIFAAFEARFASRKLTGEIIGASSEAMVRGNEVRLTQLFTNVLENCCRYTNEGGRVRVTVEATPREVLLRFEDSPPSVPKNELPRLFERFYRSEASRSREHGGSGLGLAIVERIALAHEGRVVAKQSVLGGLCVEVALPRC